MNKAVSSYNVLESINIIDFLKEKMVDKSKNNIKSLLINNCVYVNDRLVNKGNFLLKENDSVLVILKQIKDKIYKNNINVIYEDEYFIGINKPSGLLSISNSKEDRVTAYSIVRNYIKKNNKNNKIFILHRLDRDTSGILLFCKDEKIKKIMQDEWNKLVLKRGYLAIVNGRLNSCSGIIKSYLYETKDYRVVSSNDSSKGKLAITNYNVIKKGKKYSLLQVFIDTGRKNQIRVHMNQIGVSILGDKKYGIKDGYKRLYLHSNILEFFHPIKNNLVSIKCFCDDFDIKL